MADIAMPETMNGPMEVGLAAAAGDMDDAASRLTIYPSAQSTLVHAPVPHAADEVVKKLTRVAIALIIRNHWYNWCGVVSANVVISANAPAGAPNLPGGVILPAFDQAWFDAVTAEEVQRATLMVMATKVNMWTINHHTGQAALQGFALKAFGVVFPAGTNQTAHNIRCMWMAGHWISTQACWAKWGVTDLRPAPTKALTDHVDTIPGATRDIRIRMEAGPAGAAGVLTHRAIAELAMRNAYSVLLPPCADYQALIAIDKVQLSARQHEGSGHFTGNPKVELHDLSPEAREYLASYVHSVHAGSQISKAKVILTKNDVQGSDVYTNIVSLLTSMRLSSADPKTKAMVKAMIGVSPGGDPFAGAREAAAMAPRKIPTDEELAALVEAMAAGNKGAGSSSSSSAK